MINLKQVKSASDVLQVLLQNSKSPLAQQFVRWRLWRYWNEIVGDEWAALSRPVEFDNGKLIVWVASSAHLYEMTYILRPLKLKINQYLQRDYVVTIRLTQDRKFAEVASAQMEQDLGRLDKWKGQEPDPGEL